MLIFRHSLKMPLGVLCMNCILCWKLHKVDQSSLCSTLFSLPYSPAIAILLPLQIIIVGAVRNIKQKQRHLPKSFCNTIYTVAHMGGWVLYRIGLVILQYCGVTHGWVLFKIEASYAPRHHIFIHSAKSALVTYKQCTLRSQQIVCVIVLIQTIVRD